MFSSHKNGLSVNDVMTHHMSSKWIKIRRTPPHSHLPLISQINQARLPTIIAKFWQYLTFGNFFVFLFFNEKTHIYWLHLVHKTPTLLHLWVHPSSLSRIGPNVNVQHSLRDTNSAYFFPNYWCLRQLDLASFLAFC